MAQNEPNILPHLSTNFVTVGEKSTVGAPLVTPSFKSSLEILKGAPSTLFKKCHEAGVMNLHHHLESATWYVNGKEYSHNR